MSTAKQIFTPFNPNIAADAAFGHKAELRRNKTTAAGPRAVSARSTTSGTCGYVGSLSTPSRLTTGSAAFRLLGSFGGFPSALFLSPYAQFKSVALPGRRFIMSLRGVGSHIYNQVSLFEFVEDGNC